VPTVNEAFSQLSSRLSSLSSGKVSVNVGMSFRESGNDQLKSFRDDLRSLIAILTNSETLDELALIGAQAVQRNVLARASGAVGGLGSIEYRKKEGGTGTFGQLEQIDLWGDVISKLEARPVKLGGGKAGFASRSDLSSVRLTGKLVKNVGLEAVDQATRTRRKTKTIRTQTDSPYAELWQIAEFGTGIHAEPQVRRSGTPSKMPDGSWRLGRLNLYGQPGSHFLFPFRKNLEDAREDLEAARRAISARIGEILQGQGT
jgi:hypothetical protein